MKHFQLIPDSKLTNDKVDHLTQSLNQYKTPYQRYKDKEQNFFSYEIYMEKNKTSFNLTTNNGMAELAEKSLLSSFPNITVKAVDDPLNKIKPIAMKSMDYKSHYFLSVKVDRRTDWLVYLLETLSLMKKNEKCLVQILCVPLHLDWGVGVKEGYEGFKKGELPHKFHFNKKEVANLTAKGVAGVILGAHNTMVELMGFTPDKHDIFASDRASILTDGMLRAETQQKAKYGGYNVRINICIECEEKRNAILMRAIETAFNVFDGDNKLLPSKRNIKYFESMKKRKIGLLQSNYMSSLEVSRLMYLPGSTLQEKYGLERITMSETVIPAAVTKGGMLLGSNTYKGTETNIYMPVKNHDELCLPYCAIGGMGQGKTNGYGANKLVEAVRNGFGALIIDPAKKEVTEQITKVLKPEEYEIINIKELKPSFDWCEAKYSEDSKTIIQDTVLSFFEDTLEDTVQTERYLRAFVIAMRTTKMSELFKIMEDKKYLKDAIKRMPEGLHKITLEQYENEKDGMRMKIVRPIYNRLDMIMGDPFLNECFQGENELDFVKILCQKKAFVIDVSKMDGLTPKQINIIGNLLMTKINLAMQMRKKEDQLPFFVIIDEPHQFNRSATLWKSMAVESRKWRVSFTWLFHYWEQIHKDARLAIKNALPHYHLYPTSKETWKAFLEEVAPFNLEECMKLKRFHAINILRTGGENTVPFVANMALPPVERLKKETPVL
ncbi:hypothetical protein CN692_13225 [Bacillus sp. AFS002410]|uniref:hypothetical protein n=1 Tax=Bacillus sp. AFS002410 TaxID=2033481 RepID=UPI000BEFEA66|nr:hypothetical protein [Bacillus sp. AFS002410]PEJ57369.1 hypothetical protein CN692_13225 [Bacillus sp. AFS002410]